MENENIVSVVTAVFNGADEKNWAKIENAFAPEVLLDYTSMSGGEPVKLSPQQITGAWKQLFPGMDRTHHAISNFNIAVQDGEASVYAEGIANHFMDGKVWTVEGTYEVKLVRSGAGWAITAFKFNLEKQSGDTQMPGRARQRAAEMANR